MGYKRKARVIFLSEGEPSLAISAEIIAQQSAADRVEARAAWLTPHAGNTALLDAALLDWADLVVTLDAAAAERCPALPSRVQQRHYPVAENPQAELQQRIACMVGGLRLMERAGHE